MIRRHPRRTTWAATSLLTFGAAAALVLLAAPAAQAHPLGNFTVNHYEGLTLFPDHVELAAVMDRAEIPTLQARDAIDTNHDGVLEPAELAAAARTGCSGLAAAIDVRIDGAPIAMAVDASALQLQPGAAGLPTSRLTCALAAPAHIDRPMSLTVADNADRDRVGWHEITAIGRGTHIEHSPVPRASISAELRHYPNDLLSSPLDVRTATLAVAPGTGTDSGAAFSIPAAGIAERFVGRVNNVFNGLVGSPHLTLGVGLAALLLSLVLGASHAALPGHGKTVMAAYLAGKNGTVRDAVTVGATVTFTHTAGVLLLGLLVSVSASVAGESVVGWLGAVSGALVAMIGAGLLKNALAGRRPRLPHTHGHGRGHRHDHNGHAHGHGGDHEEDHGRDDGAHSGERRPDAGHDHHHDHGHHHGHDHEPRRGGDHGHDHAPSRRHSRRALVGMGMAGGLVPSPSALVVLLGAVALGRTAFGVALVVGYGLGMAATLTAAGLLLVKLSRTTRVALRGRTLGARLAAYTPVGTALLVLTVGLGLAVRSLTTLS